MATDQRRRRAVHSALDQIPSGAELEAAEPPTKFLLPPPNDLGRALLKG
jgi:hypothetical protein